MQFQTTKLDGPWLIGLQPALDGRGYFARTFCGEEFASTRFLRSISPSTAFPILPKKVHCGVCIISESHAEVKLLRCLRGTIWDVIVDIQPEIADLPLLARLRALR